jgi:hypothetical protein
MKQQPLPPKSAAIISTLMPHSRYGSNRQKTLKPFEWNEVLAGTRILYAIGTVTYLDRMDRKRHRHFYGRQYIPNVPGNNLVFMEDPPYNYEEDLD